MNIHLQASESYWNIQAPAKNNLFSQSSDIISQTEESALQSTATEVKLHQHIMHNVFNQKMKPVSDKLDLFFLAHICQ